MKKCTILLLTSLAFFSLNSYAIGINEKELQSAGSETIVFENYSGPHTKIETIDAIRSIGINLGSQVRSHSTEAKAFATGEKYSVIHAIDPDTKEKLDADIFILGNDAQVDHITNLRRIIGAYLEEAYGYSQKDAFTVATFVTVYNAVYRNDLDTFSAKYKDVVKKYLVKEKCGLSVKWNEWAGNSEIVIPLGEFAAGGLSSVETSVISDKNVVSSMQDDDDKNITERKNMVDIKEREAEDAYEKAQESAQELSEENEKLAEQKKAQQSAEKDAAEAKKDADKAEKDAAEAKKDADKAEKEAVEAEKKAEEAKKEAAANPNDAEKQKAAKDAAKEAAEAEKNADNAAKGAAEAEKNADEAKKNAENEQQKTAEQQKVVDEKAEEAANQQKKADKKLDEAQNERKEIAEDQQKLMNEALKESKDGVVVGLKVTDNDRLLSAMVKINGKTGAVIKESPVTSIRNRTLIPIQGAVTGIASDESFAQTSSEDVALYMAVCGEDSGAIKLCLIDAYKLEIQKESEEILSGKSMLVNSGSGYFCIVKDDSGCYLAKYDKNLAVVSKSQITVSESTPITVTPQGIIVTDASGSSILLSLADLAVVSK